MSAAMAEHGAYILLSLDGCMAVDIPAGSLSAGDDDFTGVVSEIDKTASSSGGVTMYTATVTLDKTEQMPGGSEGGCCRHHRER